MKPTFITLLLVAVVGLATHELQGQIPAFLFDWESVAGDVDFAKRVHSSFAFTEIYGGGGTVTCLQDLPATESVAGNPPLDLAFVFGSGNSLITEDPALSLTGFDNSGTVVVQEFTATSDNALAVFDRGNRVADGIVLDVTVLTPPSLFSTGYGRFQLTGDAGGDPTIFNELFALSGDTGILSFSLANFAFSGTGTDPGLFVAEGIGAPGAPPSLDPANPLWPVSSTDEFVFDIPAFPGCVPPPTYFDPEVTIGYDYAATNTNFVSVILPDIGDGAYDLLLWDGSNFSFERELVAGEEFVFEAAGVDRFRILGIEMSAQLDPTDPLAFVTGLRFTSTADASMSMTPLVPDADFNGDGLVDTADYTVWRDSLGAEVPRGEGADANFDGIVDQADYLEWQQRYGQSIDNVLGNEAVPEPAVAMILLMSLVGLGTVRR